MKKLVAILGYHKIGIPPRDWYTWNYVSENNFEADLDLICRNNWEVLSAEKFIKSLSDPEILPERSVLITFDDGYKNNLSVALPCLRKFRFSAVLFIPVKFVGTYNAFDADINYEPREDICSWEELKQLEEGGISVHSHSVSHRHFSALNREEKKAEIIKSKKLIEQKLKKSVSLFSFPYGDNGNDQIETRRILLDSGYKGAFLYQGGVMDVFHSDKFQIPRIPVGADTDLQKELKDALFF